MSKPTSNHIVTRLCNDDGKTYFVVIASPNPGEFVRKLWESIDDGTHGYPEDDYEACQEWTDRGKCFRTTVNHEGVCIRTHAWHPDGDTKELHPDVLNYIRSQGVPV